MSAQTQKADLARLLVLVADDEPPIRLLCQVNLAVAGIEPYHNHDPATLRVFPSRSDAIAAIAPANATSAERQPVRGEA